MRKYIIGLIVAGLVGLGLWAVMTGCGKKPTEPVEGKEYPLYFIAYKENGIDKKYYRYLPYSQQLDSFVLPVSPWQHMSVSADGGQLWIDNRDSIYVCDVASQSVIASLDYSVGGSRIAFSPDNSMAAIMGGSLRIISTTDYNIIFEDSGRGANTRFSDGRFSPDGKSFHCGNNPGFAYNLDIANGFQSEWIDITALGETEHAFQLPNSDDIAAIKRTGIFTALFMIYSPSLDSLLFSYTLLPEPAYMQLSPNGKSLYLTAAGSLLMGPSPLFSYAVYDIESNQVEPVEIPVDLQDANFPYFPLNKVALSPVGKWVAGAYHDYPFYISIYDIQIGDSLQSPVLLEKYYTLPVVQEFP